MVCLVEALTTIPLLIETVILVSEVKAVIVKALPIGDDTGTVKVPLLIEATVEENKGAVLETATTTGVGSVFVCLVHDENNNERVINNNIFS